MDENQSLQEIAREREMECRVQADALDRWLCFFAKLNWLTVVLPAALSAFAGAVILNAIVPDWTVGAGVAALLSSVLVIIHKAKNCDAHQSECRRLSKAYRGLAIRYRSFYQVGSKEPDNEIRTLEATLASINETAAARAPRSLLDKAQQALNKKVAEQVAASDR